MSTATPPNNTILLIGLAVIGFMFLQRQQPRNTGIVPGAYPGHGTMPGSTGSGMDQVKAGAIAGLLQGLVSGFNNTSNASIPRLDNNDQLRTDYFRGDILQEAVPDVNSWLVSGSSEGVLV